MQRLHIEMHFMTLLHLRYAFLNVIRVPRFPVYKTPENVTEYTILKILQITENYTEFIFFMFRIIINSVKSRCISTILKLKNTDSVVFI